MSYHIIHILQHNSYLSVDHGFLVLKTKEQERRALLSEILIVVVAAKGVSFSGNALSEIIKNGGVILHCDEHYKPIGKTVGLPSVIHSQVFKRQVERDNTFNNKVWSKIIQAKIINQAETLDIIGAYHKLWEYINEKNWDEGNAARHYWKYYFMQFGKLAPAGREHFGAEHPINQMLNYAYAVLGALCHRSILAHGLNPCLGVHHKYRFKSEPLLYDLMEPLRPFCDLILFLAFQKDTDITMSNFAKEIAKNLANIKIRVHGKNIKFIHAIDQYISSVAQCFNTGYIKLLTIPEIQDLQC